MENAKFYLSKSPRMRALQLSFFETWKSG